MSQRDASNKMTELAGRLIEAEARIEALEAALRQINDYLPQQSYLRAHLQNFISAALNNPICSKKPNQIKIEDIQRAVARQYNVSRSDLLSSRRTAEIVRPRQVAMYLAKILTACSLPEIGRRFGSRDHTTVLHSVHKIEVLITKNTALSEDVEILKQLCRINAK